MLKKLKFSLIIFFLNNSLCIGQIIPQQEFYDSTQNQILVKSLYFDSSFVLLYNVVSNGNFAGISLAVFDNQFNLKWKKIYLPNNFNSCKSHNFLKSSDKGYLITGSTTESNNIDSLLLMKVDSTGNILWIKTYANQGARLGIRGLISYEDSLKNIITLGVVQNITNISLLSASLFKIKTDSIGEFISSKIFYGDSINVLDYSSSNFDKGQDGIYFTIWKDYSTYFLCKIDDRDSITYSKKTYTALSYGYDIRMKEMQQNNLIFAGYSETLLNDGMVAGKIDSLGNEEWAYQYSSDSNFSLIGFNLLPNNDIILFGFTYDDLYSSKSDGILISLNSSGNINWAKKYLLSKHQDVINLINNTFTLSNQILVLGATDNSMYTNFYKHNVFSIDFTGNSDCEFEEFPLYKFSIISPSNSVHLNTSLFPMIVSNGSIRQFNSSFNSNFKCYESKAEIVYTGKPPLISKSPFNEFFKIIFENTFDFPASIYLFNSNGQLILKDENISIEKNVNGSNLAAGIYILKIITKSHSYQYKLIKL